MFAAGDVARGDHAFVDALQSFAIGYSWGGVSSVVAPWSLAPDRAPYGDRLVRLYVGLEDTADLIADLEGGLAALARASSHRPSPVGVTPAEWGHADGARSVAHAPFRVSRLPCRRARRARARARRRTPGPRGLRLDTVRSGGMLRVGMTGDYKPYTFLADDGTWSGLDVDVARALATALGVQVAFVRTSWPAMTGDLVAGEFDVAMGGVSRDPKRAAAGLLSPPYVVDGKVALIRAADSERFRTLADLDVATTRVALNPGGTNESFDHGISTRAAHRGGEEPRDPAAGRRAARTT